MAKENRVSMDVYQDLGFSKEESEQIRLRSSMMNAILRELDRRQLTQRDAAALLGVSQPRVSQLTRGKLHVFSLDMLIRFASALGLQVELRVRKVA